METGLIIVDAVTPAPKDGIVQLVMTNLSGFSQVVEEGQLVGEILPVNILVPDPNQHQTTGNKAAYVKKLSLSAEQWRKKKLMEVLEFPATEGDAT